MRLGLCCVFVREPIRFRRATAAQMGRWSRGEQLARLSTLCLDNAAALARALEWCADHAIGAFRVNSQILPLVTHPAVGYGLEELPDAQRITAALRACGRLARARGLRVTFHPDQFVVLSSPSEDVARRSVEELAYQARVAELVGADVLTLHGGGAYGEPRAALERLARRIEGLARPIRSRLALENDDRVYSPAALLPVCEALHLPFVYDPHHHRCLPDGLSPEEATDRAVATWSRARDRAAPFGREPLFHASSPQAGRRGRDLRPHADFVDVRDIPACWFDCEITVEVEAKAKELAIERLQRSLSRSRRGRPRRAAARRGRRDIV